MQLETKYLVIFFASLFILLVFGYLLGVTETPDESVTIEESQIYTNVLGDLRQIEN
jgi:hypothetical protein